MKTKTTEAQQIPSSRNMNKITVILSNCLKPMIEKIFKKKPVEKDIFSTEEQRMTADFS